MKTLLSLTLLTLLAACSGLPEIPDQPPPPSVTQTIAQADKQIEGGYDALALLGKWQHRNRAILKTTPALQAQLKAQKARVWTVIENSTKRRDAFEKDSTGPNRSQLESSLLELNKALDDTAKWLAERAAGMKVR